MFAYSLVLIAVYDLYDYVSCCIRNTNEQPFRVLTSFSQSHSSACAELLRRRRTRSCANWAATPKTAAKMWYNIKTYCAVHHQHHQQQQQHTQTLYTQKQRQDSPSWPSGVIVAVSVVVWLECIWMHAHYSRLLVHFTNLNFASALVCFSFRRKN